MQSLTISVPSNTRSTSHAQPNGASASGNSVFSDALSIAGGRRPATSSRENTPLGSDDNGEKLPGGNDLPESGSALPGNLPDAATDAAEDVAEPITSASGQELTEAEESGSKAAGDSQSGKGQGMANKGKAVISVEAQLQQVDKLTGENQAGQELTGEAGKGEAASATRKNAEGKAATLAANAGAGKAANSPLGSIELASGQSDTSTGQGKAGSNLAQLMQSNAAQQTAGKTFGETQAAMVLDAGATNASTSTTGPTSLAQAGQADRSAELTALVDRLVEGRVQARSERNQVEVNHPDFGRVTLSLNVKSGDQLSVDLPGAPAELRQAVKAALASSAARNEGQSGSNDNAQSQNSQSQNNGQLADGRGQENSQNNRDGNFSFTIPGAEQDQNLGKDTDEEVQMSDSQAEDRRGVLA